VAAASAWCRGALGGGFSGLGIGGIAGNLALGGSAVRRATVGRPVQPFSVRHRSSEPLKAGDQILLEEPDIVRQCLNAPTQALRHALGDGNRDARPAAMSCVARLLLSLYSNLTTPFDARI
jgi:hypothetical protein